MATRWPTVKQERASKSAGKAAIFRALAMPIAAVLVIELVAPEIAGGVTGPAYRESRGAAIVRALAGIAEA